MKSFILTGLASTLGLLQSAQAAPTPSGNNNAGFIGQNSLNGTTHQTGGEHYVVLFKPQSARKRAAMPHVEEVLAALDLTPDNSDVMHMYTGSTYMRGFSANMKSHCLDILANRDDIAIVEKNQEVRYHQAQTVQANVNGQAPWGLQALSSGPMRIQDATGFTHTYRTAAGSNLGQGVDVYVGDTGVNTQHKAFGGRATLMSTIQGQDTDKDGHGTHVSGTIGGNGIGVAPNVNIRGIKLLDDQGVGNTATILDGMQLIADSHKQRKQEQGFVGSVVNFSLGGPKQNGQPSAMEQAANSLVENGIHVVVSAGNDGGNACENSPAAAGGANGNLITVGSFGTNYAISSFSNTGPCVDIYAPGERIVSSWITGDESTMVLQGTSMASPHITGLVAYAAGDNPELAQNPAKMKAFLKSSALQQTLDGQVYRGDPVLMANNGFTN